MAELRSVSLLWLASLAAAGFALVTQTLIARTVLPAEYGLYAASVTAAAIVAPLAGLGIPGFLLKVFATEGTDARRWLPGSLKAMAVSIVLGLLTCVAYTYSIRKDYPGFMIGLALTPVMLSYVGAEIAISRHQVEDNPLSQSLWTVAPNLLRVLIALIAWIASWSIMSIAIGIGAVSVGMVSISTWGILNASWDRVPEVPSSNIDRKNKIVGMKHAASATWRFGLSPFVFMVFSQGGVLMLEAHGLSKDAGIFSLVANMLSAVYLAPTVVSQRFFLARFHRWSVHDKTRFLEVYRVCCGLSLAFGGIAGIALTVISPPLFRHVFGELYWEVGSILALCAIALPARFLSCFMGAALSTKDNMKPRLRAQIAVVLVMLPVGWFAIARYGLFGAAVSTIASECLLALAYFAGCARHVFGIDAARGWTLNLKGLSDQ